MTDVTAGGPGNAEQEAYFASTRGTLAPPGTLQTATARAGETLELKYMRQTRTAVVFIAVVVGVVCALSLVAAIFTGIQLAKVDSQLNLGGNTSSNSSCASQGGTDTSC